MCASQCQFWASELGSKRSQPTLNQTGELNADLLVQKDVGRARRRRYWRRSAGGEVAVANAPVADALGNTG